MSVIMPAKFSQHHGNGTHVRFSSMRYAMFCLLATATTFSCVFLYSTVAAAKPDEQYITDFATLYENWESFQADVDYVNSQIEEIGNLEGRAQKNARELADVLDAISNLEERASKLFFYSILQRNIDITSDKAQQAYDVASSLKTRVDGATGFLSLDINQISLDDLRKWISSEPRLRPYQIQINALINLSKYKKDASGEAYLSDIARAVQLSPDIWTALMQSNLGWNEVVTSSGETVVADAGAYRRYRRSGSRKDRNTVVQAHLKHLGALSEAIGLAYTRRVEGDWTVARRRGFESGAHAWWVITEQIPPGTTETMVEVIRNNRDLLHRYIELRAEVLDLSDFEYGDFLAPASNIETKISVDETIERLTAIYEIFGEERQDALRTLVKEPLLHLAPSDVKSAEWGILPGVGGSKPYLRMNYQGSYGDSRRLAAGLSTLLGFSERSEDIKLTADDSAVGPGLYATYLLYDQYSAGLAQTDEERISLLLAVADRFWYSLFRNLIIIELDLKVETLIKAGKTPTGAQISDIYYNLLKDYYGDIEIAPVYAHEWMTNFVPFLNYAHHNWSASVISAAAVIERQQAGEDVSHVFFSEVTKSEDSDRGYHVLLESGVDLATQEPYDSAMRFMETALDKLETTLNAQ